MDGIKSRVRIALLGEDNPATKAVFLGKMAYWGVIPMDKAVELLGEEYAENSRMYLELQGHVFTFCIETDKTMNGMQYFVIRRFLWSHSTAAKAEIRSHGGPCAKKDDVQASFA